MVAGARAVAIVDRDATARVAVPWLGTTLSISDCARSMAVDRGCGGVGGQVYQIDSSHRFVWPKVNLS